MFSRQKMRWEDDDSALRSWPEGRAQSDAQGHCQRPEIQSKLQNLVRKIWWIRCRIDVFITLLNGSYSDWFEAGDAFVLWYEGYSTQISWRAKKIWLTFNMFLSIQMVFGKNKQVARTFFWLCVPTWKIWQATFSLRAVCCVCFSLAYIRNLVELWYSFKWLLIFFSLISGLYKNSSRIIN